MSLKNVRILAISFICIITIGQGCGQYQSIDTTSENSENSSNINFNEQFKASDFVDTGANFSLVQDNSLFTFDSSTGVMMVSTSSNLDNIHSHYMDGGSFGNYTFSGSMLASDSASGVGVTFLSDYPNSDDYYRLANDSAAGSFQLSARNSLTCQGVDSGLVTQAGEWYSFKILVKSDSMKTTILAKVWPSFAREPFDAQMNCVDSSGSRRTQGTIGLWASGAGDKQWGDLFLGFDPYLPTTVNPPTPPSPVPSDCGALAHGQSESRTRYQSQTVAFGSTCQSEVQMRTCNDGQLSSYAPNNYQFDSCTVSQAPPSNDEEATIRSVTASSDDGNSAANVIDNNLATRWSANGDGEYIDLNFGALYDVSRIEVAYFRANERSATFDVELLINGSYVRVLTGQQSGNTNNLTNYAINNNQTASGIRIIGRGNSMNTWNSITEVKVYGENMGGIPTPPPTPTPPAPTPSDCGSVAHGQSETRTRYQAQTVPFGSTCQSEVQTRTCNDGVLSAYAPNNYQFNSCSVDPAPPTPNPPPAPTPDADGDGIPDSSDPCPNDPNNACQSGTPIANSAALNAALAKARGGEVFILAPGNYGFLNIDGRQFSSTVTIRSANPSSPASFDRLVVRNSSNITFDGLTFDYTFNSGDFEFSSYFFLNGASKITFINSIFDGDVARTGGAIDGFGFTMGLKGQHVSDLNIINNTFHTWHRGMYFLFGSNVKVSGNDIHTIRSDGMNFGEITGLTIEKNYVHDFKSPTGVGDHRDMIQILRSTGKACSDIIIRNNIFDVAAGDYAQTLWAGGDGSNAVHQRVLVENNIIYNGHINGIVFHNTDNLTYRKNTMLVDQRSFHSVPAFGGGGANATADRNIVQQFIGGSSWNQSGNAFLKPGEYNANFIVHATSQNDGYNEYSLRPGSAAANLGAGSDLMKLYPIGKAQTIHKLRALP